MPLPFLIVHGAGLWKWVLVGFVLLCIGLVLLVRRLDAQRSARKATQWIEHEGGEIVRGTLGGGSITTLILDRDRAVNHRDPELWIETTDGRVPLVGDDIRAVSGSRMSQKRNGAPKRTPKSMFDDPAVHRPRLRGRTISIASLFELAPGDRVIARGALVREPGTQATDYRESVTTLSLHGPIMIGATAPRGVAARPSWIALALIAGVMGPIGYKIESGLGDSWRSDCFDRDHDHGPHPFELSNTHACVLANTMPDESYVLDQLVYQFARSPITSDAELGQHVLLAHAAGGCKSSLELLERLAQPDALLAEAVKCGDRKTQQHALTQLGRFDDAAKLGPLENRAGSLYILGRQWAEAAKLAETNAAAAQRPASAKQWRCLAELMRWYGGDQGARARVQAMDPGETPQCRAELAEMATGADRDHLLLLGASRDAFSLAYTGLTLEETAALSIQQVLVGRPALMQEDIGSYLAKGSSELQMISGAGVWAVATSPEPPADATEPLFEPGQGQYAYYSTRIISRVHDGDLVGAHHDADRAIAIAKPMYEYSIYSRRELGVLHALIDLHGVSTTTPYEPALTDNSLEAELQNYLMPHILLRHGQPISGKQWIGGDLQPLEAAAQGDATKLVDGLFGEYSEWTQLDVLSVLPRVTIKRAELLTAMRWGNNSGDRMIGYDFPWCSIAYAAERRTLFDVGGEHDEAARWAAIYARYRKALTDRKSLIALALWNQL
jgi:hypothetical protein